MPLAVSRRGTFLFKTKYFCFNFRAKQLMTRKLAWIAIFIVAAVMIVVASPLFAIYRSTDDVICRFQDSKIAILIAKIHVWGEIFIYTLVPSTIIITSNSVIVLTLYRNRETSNTTVKGTTSVQKSFNKITPMLLLVSTVFVCCTCPISLFKMSKYLTASCSF